MRRLWSIVSNAALRSIRTRLVPYLLLRSHNICVVTLDMVSIDLGKAFDTLEYKKCHEIKCRS